MKLFSYSLLLLFITSCGKSDTFNADDTESYSAALKTAKTLLKEKKYKEVEAIYEWLKEKKPQFYKDSVLLDHIHLFGLQERFEKQLDYYTVIFRSDSLNNESVVPHFYYNIGKAYQGLAKVKKEGKIDSVTLASAITYFRKAYKYQLFTDRELHSVAIYNEALCHIIKNDTSTASKRLHLVLNDYFKTEAHPKAYFKLQDITNPNDILLTSQQITYYNQVVAPKYTDSTTVINSEKPTLDVLTENLPQNNTEEDVVPPPPEDDEETTPSTKTEAQVTPTPVPETEKTSEKIEPTEDEIQAKKDSIINALNTLKKEKAPTKKAKPKKKGSGIILENTEE